MPSQSVFFQQSNSLKRCVTSLAVIVAVVLCDRAASAQAPQPQPTSGFGAVAQKLNPTNWKMPKPSFRLPNFLVPQTDQNRIVERKNGLFTDVKITASRSWQRTKETFNPARLNPMNLFTAGATTPTPPAPKEPGFFSRMFSPPASEPEARVADVNGFLEQQRPR